jgi:hypothetical protein
MCTSILAPWVPQRRRKRGTYGDDRRAPPRERGVGSTSSRSRRPRLRVEWVVRLALRPTISARERFYADTRSARRGNAPSRQTGSTAGPVPYTAWSFPLQTRDFPAQGGVGRHDGKRTSCSESRGPPPGAARAQRRRTARGPRRRSARAHLRRARPQARAADPPRPAGRARGRHRTPEMGAHRRPRRPADRPPARARLRRLRERARHAVRDRIRDPSQRLSAAYSGSGRFSPGHVPVR